MDYPKEFDKSPLVDATIEIRFTTSENREIIPGLIYSNLRTDFGNLIELPTLQLPIFIRDNDPNLRHQPTHKLESDDYYLNIGPNVIGLGCKIEQGKTKYPGWEKFITEFSRVLTKIEALGFIDKIDRLGIRYVNFFQRHDLFTDLNISLNTGWEGQGLQTDRVLVLAVNKGGFTSKIAINTNVVAQVKGKPKKGQIIDIDTFIEASSDVMITDKKIKNLALSAHRNTEDIFFNLLNDKLKSDLGAKYV